MVDSVGKVVLPGDTIEQLRESEATQKVIVGPGLRRQADSVVVSKPGILRFREPNVYWVDSHQKRVSKKRAFIMTREIITNISTQNIGRTIQY